MSASGAHGREPLPQRFIQPDREIGVEPGGKDVADLPQKPGGEVRIPPGGEEHEERGSLPAQQRRDGLDPPPRLEAVPGELPPARRIEVGKQEEMEVRAATKKPPYPPTVMQAPNLLHQNMLRKPLQGRKESIPEHAVPVSGPTWNGGRIIHSTPMNAESEPVSGPASSRRLATVMFLDVVGYSARMSKSESEALQAIGHFEATVKKQVPAHGGQLIKFLGDGSMVVFQTAGAAVACALKIQETIRERNATLAAADRYLVRIGLHLGEILESGGDLFGDPVNIAARIQTLADPGGIALTDTVREQIRNQMILRGTRLKNRRLRNISEPVTVFFVPPAGVNYARWYLGRHRKAVWIACGTCAAALLAAGGVVEYLSRQDVLVEAFEDHAHLDVYSGGGATLLVEAVPGVSGRAVSARYIGSTSPDAFGGVAKTVTYRAGDWRGFAGIRIAIRTLSGRKVRVVLVEQGADGGPGETHVAGIAPYPNWSTIVVPFEGFTKKTTWQPPGADNDGILDLSRIRSIAFEPFLESDSDVYEIDDLRLVRGSHGLPSVPIKPSGPVTGTANRSYTYQSVASSKNPSAPLTYTFDWGDGTQTSTTPAPPGQVVSATHSWKSAGVFEVKVKATNEHGFGSSHSDPLVVTLESMLLADFEGQAGFWAGAWGGATLFASSIQTETGAALRVYYRGAQVGGGDWEVQIPATPGGADWGVYEGLTFAAKSESGRPTTVAIVEQGKSSPDESGEHWQCSFTATREWRTIHIPFRTFTQKTWQPPAADNNKVLNLEKVKLISFLANDPGSDTLYLDDVTLLADRRALVAAAVGEVVADKVFDDFEAGLLFTEQAGDGSTVQVSLVPSATGLSLRISHNDAAKGWWEVSRTASVEREDGWAQYAGLRLNFMVEGGGPLRIILIETGVGTTMNLGEEWEYFVEGSREWRSITIPFRAFTPRATHQYPSENADLNRKLDLDRIGWFSINQAHERAARGSFYIDNLILAAPPLPE